jgi:hypothetical protein
METRPDPVQVLHGCVDYGQVGVRCGCGEAVVVLCTDCGEALAVIASIPPCAHAVAVTQRGQR